MEADPKIGGIQKTIGDGQGTELKSRRSVMISIGFFAIVPKRDALV